MISTKSKIKLFLLAYFFFLAFVPSAYNIYSLILYGLASVFTTSATCFYIAFLMSRKQAEKTILNWQILMNFWFKIAVYLQAYMIMCLHFIASKRHLNVFEQFLASTLLSQISSRIVVVLSVAIYFLISLARALVFFSPATFISVNTKHFQRVSIMIILVLFAEEVIVSQTYFTPDMCNITELGYMYHSLAFSKPNKTSSGTTKTCNFFPVIYILSVLLTLLEIIRLIAAGSRKLNLIKKKTKVSFITYNLPMSSAKPKETTRVRSESFSEFSNNPTRIPEIHVRRGSLPDTLREFPPSISLPSSSRALTPSMSLFSTSREIQPRASLPSSSSATQPCAPLPSSSRTLTPIVSLFSMSMAIQPSASLPSSHRAIQPSDSLPSSSRAILNSASLPSSSRVIQPCASLRSSSRGIQPSASLPSSSRAIHPSSSLSSARATPQLHNVAELTHNNDLVVNANSKSETLKIVDEMKTYIVSLIMRTYTVVIIIFFVGLVLNIFTDFFFREVKGNFFQFLFRLDLYFVPVFWITIDDQVFHFTTKKIKDIFLNIRMFLH